jgi:CheY-like chemotaxis protein
MDSLDYSTMRVLVIDDEPDTIEVVSMVLMAAGAQVYDAADGQEGYEVFLREKPDLVLSDLSMPGVDGWQLLQHIRATEGGDHIPVIALTAHAMAGDKERVLAAGFNGYLSKPLKMVNFLSDLQQWLTEAAH